MLYCLNLLRFQEKFSFVVHILHLLLIWIPVVIWSELWMFIDYMKIVNRKSKYLLIIQKKQQSNKNRYRKVTKYMLNSADIYFFACRRLRFNRRILFFAHWSKYWEIRTQDEIKSCMVNQLDKWKQQIFNDRNWLTLALILVRPEKIKTEYDEVPEIVYRKLWNYQC